MERDDVEALLLGLRGEDIDLFVGRDDFFGEPQVGVEQGLCGAVHGRTHQASQVDQVIADGIEFSRERLTHGAPPCGTWSTA